MEALANAVEHFESLSFRVLLTINGQLVRNPTRSILHIGFPSHTLMDVLAYCESNNLEILSIWNVSQSYATEQHAMARRLSKEDESAKSTIVMKHWKAGLHQADILERFTISLKYFCRGK